MKEPILISITGMDRPGITATVTQVLAAFDVNVLDIGQSVIHESLSLGMLIQATTAEETAVKDTLQKAINELGLAVRFVNIPRESYEHWVRQQGKGRHVITLLARRITAHHISRLSRVVVENGLNIDKITRLSGRVPLDSIGTIQASPVLNFP